MSSVVFTIAILPIYDNMGQPDQLEPWRLAVIAYASRSFGFAATDVRLRAGPAAFRPRR